MDMARCSFVGSVFRSGFLPRKSRVFSALIGLCTLEYNRWTYRGNL